jgi:hypothetical protein
MKNFTKVLFVVMVLGLGLTGCGKDGESGNYLQVGDTTITISDGNLKYYGSYSATTYNFDLDFVSPEITLSNNSGEPTYTGTGTRIYFETYTTSSTAPGNGTYTFDDSGDYLNLTYDYCYYSFNYSYSASYSSVDVEDGDLSIKKTSSGYEVNFKGTDLNGVKVKLHYAGALTYYDRSENKK